MNGESDEAFLIRYLADCHDEHCPLCGYNLRALTSARCPECGEALRLGVGLSQPHLRGWLALALPLIASAGIGVFFFVLWVGRGQLPSERRYPYLRVALAYFWMMIPLAVIVVWRRRSILRTSNGAQQSLAVIAWVVSIVAMLLVFMRGG
jgi:hypothetical protein